MRFLVMRIWLPKQGSQSTVLNYYCFDSEARVVRICSLLHHKWCVVKAREDHIHMSSAFGPEPSPGQLLPADSAAPSPEPLLTSPRLAHSLSHCTQTHSSSHFSRRSSSHQLRGPHRSYSLCLAHSSPAPSSLGLCSSGTPTGSPG